MKNLAMFLILPMAFFLMMPTGCVQTGQQAGDMFSRVEPTLVADSVVYYYKSDRSTYITHQMQGFNPDAGYFQMTATEPTGRLHCSLIRDRFNSSDRNPGSLSDLPSSFCDKNLATAVFYSFCAGADLLDAASMTTFGDEIKIEGQWYSSLKPAWPGSPALTLYRSLETNRIELTQLIDEQKGLAWMLRSYNLKYSNELNRKLPRMIDVFNIDNGVPSKELMIRFDYKEIRQAPSATTATQY